jgi:hypothetical protein
LHLSIKNGTHTQHGLIKMNAAAAQNKVALPFEFVTIVVTFE